MKLSRLFLFIVSLTVLFALTGSTASAGSMGNGAAQRMKLEVASVDAAAGTLELKSGVNQSVHDYKIVATTKISVGNKKGTADQIQVGMKVANVRAAAGPSPQTLEFIMVYAAPPAAAAAPADK